MSNPNPDTLQPGPELDHLAWAAMGRKVVAVDPFDDTPGPWLEAGDHWTMVDGTVYPLLSPLPSVSTDPAAMMECRDWLIGLGYSLEIISYPPSYAEESVAGKTDLWCHHADAEDLSDEGWTAKYPGKQRPPRIFSVEKATTLAHALALMVVKVGAKLKEAEQRG